MMSEQELVNEEPKTDEPAAQAPVDAEEVSQEEVVVASAEDEAEVEDAAEAEDAADDDSSTIFNLKPRQQLSGTVKNITPFGAFIDMGLPQDGLVHISELSRKKVEKVEDVVSVGQAVEVWVKKVDRKRGRISLTMIKPVVRRIKDVEEDDELEGIVTRLEPYGAFINIDSERDGLVHISQITHAYINHPQEALTVGETVKVKVLKVNKKKRQVDLSIKALLEPPVVEEEEKPKPKAHVVKEEPVVEVNTVAEEEEEPIPTAMAVAFASLQDKSVTASAKETASREGKKHREIQSELIARTLASTSK
jgi:transcriptional accessory protein Tex/SPT6